MAHITYPKPLKGEYRLEQKKNARHRKAIEEKVMAEAKRRDRGLCRWTGCEFKDLRVEAAHLEHRGMGGNPALDRTERHKLIALCVRHHQLFDHTKIDVVPIEPRGADGPCEFYTRMDTGGWALVGRERSIHVPETRGA